MDLQSQEPYAMLVETGSHKEDVTPLVSEGWRWRGRENDN